MNVKKPWLIVRIVINRSSVEIMVCIYRRNVRSIMLSVQNVGFYVREKIKKNILKLALKKT